MAELEARTAMLKGATGGAKHEALAVFMAELEQKYSMTKKGTQ